MKLLKTFLVHISFLMILLSACNQGSEHDAIIEGRLSDASGLSLILFELLPDSARIIDSTITDKQGNFRFRFKPEEKSFYFIRQNSRNYLTFIADKGDRITLAGDGGNLMSTYRVEGSEDSKVLSGYFRIVAASQSRFDSLGRKLEDSKSLLEFPKIKEQLDSMFIVVSVEHQANVRSYAEQHKGSFASMLVVNHTLGKGPVLTPEVDPQLFAAIDSNLSLMYKGNRHYEAFHQKVSGRSILKNP